MKSSENRLRQTSRFLAGMLILAIIFIQIGREISDLIAFRDAIVACLLVLVFLISASARGVVLLFLGIAIGLTLLAAFIDPQWQGSVWKALLNSAFFVAFFSSLATLKNAAASSPAMSTAGTFLASQPPGRRYIALSAGAQAFAIVLNYGSIQLLGTLAMTSANKESDQRIRKIRIRRMLQAIHRGFISSLPWSPLSFSIAISVAVIPGTSWGQLAVPGIITSLIILCTGWALDTIFKPVATGGVKREETSPGHWSALLPLALLLAIMMSLLLTLSAAFSIRVIGLVLMIIPVLSLIWVIWQLGGIGGLGARLKPFIATELPSYSKEIMLIATAGYIGATGSVLIEPAMRTSGLDLTLLPTWFVLLALVWIMPLLGQIGANPILSMSLIGPLLPPAEQLGITPTGLALALICGWTMTGISSPFTATNLLIGRFGEIRPIDVGWVWNRSFFFITTALLCTWSLVFAFAFNW